MKSTFSKLAIMLLVIFNLVACSKDENEPKFKIGLATGLGSLNDRGFNQQAYDGLTEGAAATNSEWEVRESSDLAGLESNIAYFCDQKFDLIITVTYDAAQFTYDAAIAHPDLKFILLDHSFDQLPGNLACITYEVDQVSFPAGFLAAWWAYKTDPNGVVAGFVAGPEIPPILQFTRSFSAGVDHFNNKYGLEVITQGAHATDFNDTLQGANMAESLIQNGADLIFACAGRTGNGALYQALSSGIVAIGVDTDQYIAIPEVGSILLTSCMKRLDQSIYTEIISFSQGAFHGGTTLSGNLENQGVELAPFHDFDNQVPDSIKVALSEIKQGIINGSINTGAK